MRGKQSHLCIITGALMMLIVYIMIAVVFGISVPHTMAGPAITIRPRPAPIRMGEGETDRVIRAVKHNSNTRVGPHVSPQGRVYELTGMGYEISVISGEGW